MRFSVREVRRSWAEACEKRAAEHFPLSAKVSRRGDRGGGNKKPAPVEKA